MTVEDRVKSELTPIDLEARFDETLDECYSFKSVGGPFEYMSPSRVLREVDPIAYQIGVSDYDTETIVEIDGEYYDLREVEEIRESVNDGA